MRVPWMPKPVIAAAAEAVLADYGSKTGAPVVPPVPVEAVIEHGLGLTLAYGDLRGRLGMDDVLGAAFFERGLVMIEERLLEEGSQGRYFFTCAHEAGHFVLHRELVAAACRAGGYEARILCRQREARARQEWQADYFAGCLLMPEAHLRAAFEGLCGGRPLVIENRRSTFCGPVSFDPAADTWPRIAQAVMAAGGFDNVSKQAMIIRLQELGLVVNRSGAHLGWPAAAAG